MVIGLAQINLLPCFLADSSDQAGADRRKQFETLFHLRRGLFHRSRMELGIVVRYKLSYHGIEQFFFSERMLHIVKVILVE